MAEAFIGEIRCVSFNYAPDGWLLCNGQSLPISQYQILFSLIGTTFGGDGQTTFQIPNLNNKCICGSPSTTILKNNNNTITYNIPVNYTIPSNIIIVILENE
jgi:microcystin-dependent protein